MKESGQARESNASEQQTKEEPTGFFHTYGPILFLIGFVAYLILLTIGVIAEIFDIESILDWWIWRPPGKD